MALFGTSGIRRVIDSSLLGLALKVGLVMGQTYGRVVVGCDARTSGDAMKHAFISGLLAAGSEAYDAGVIPTPTLALAARGFQAGAMITASHNPPEYNGIKLINPDGSAFDGEQQRLIEDAVSANSLTVAPWENIKNGAAYEGAVARHIERIREHFPGKFKVKVVLDCACGAASSITPALLSAMGCEVVAMNCYPSGFFPHDVEPTAENLGDLIRVTTEVGADLGIAHDGDADRMMAVDDKGRFIPGAKQVVTTVDASMGVEEMGFGVIRTRVGDTHVSQELKKGGDFGGEPSGGWIFPAISLCPDGIYAAARVVALASQHRLSSLVDDIPAYSLLRGSIRANGVATSRLGEALMALEPLSVSNIDGTRLSFADGWLLVRASGTEPKIRLTAEAKDEMRARQLYDSGVRAVEGSCQSEGKGT